MKSQNERTTKTSQSDASRDRDISNGNAFKDKRIKDRRKRIRRFNDLNDEELLEYYRDSIIPDNSYVLQLKLKRFFLYTLQAVVAVMIGLSINPQSEYKTYIVLGLMILIGLKHDLPDRIVKYFDNSK